MVRAKVGIWVAVYMWFCRREDCERESVYQRDKE